MFYDDFGSFGDSWGEENEFMGGMGYGYGGMGYKPIKATNRNVQDEIAFRLGVDPMAIKFVKLDDLPVNLQNWKHACFQGGVSLMQPNEFFFDDGSRVVFAICPFFPTCNTVQYYIDKY